MPDFRSSGPPTPSAAFPYPSGDWMGYWDQRRLGRQVMSPLRLEFAGGRVRGAGVDVIGEFSLSGEIRPDASWRFVKKYEQGHAVIYHGEHDGEGTIHGVWVLEHDRGPFAIRPLTVPSIAELPIQEL